MVLKITVLALIACGLGFADPITFTIQGIGSGTVGATPFNNEAFSLSVTTDTSLITGFGTTGGETGFETPEVAGAGISIAGVGAGIFTDAEQIFDSNFAEAGITDFPAPPGVSNDLLDGTNVAFLTYNLQSDIGPLSMSDITALNNFVDIPTSLGSVTFTIANAVFFTAASPLVAPEPGTLVLGAAGLLLAVGIKRPIRAT
jgi:hypothetical protein